MSGPFKVGDVVVKVAGSASPIVHNKPVRIIGFSTIATCGGCGSCQGLYIAGHPNTKPNCDGWAGHNFRHLPKADEQFTAQIRACRPIRKGVDA